jgi:hypothetical protein
MSSGRGIKANGAYRGVSAAICAYARARTCMLRERRAQRVVKRIPGCLSRETLGVALRCAGEGDDDVARGGQERREGQKRKGGPARTATSKVGVSGAIDVARRPRCPLNFRSPGSLVILSRLARRKAPSLLPAPFAPVDESLQCHGFHNFLV